MRKKIMLFVILLIIISVPIIIKVTHKSEQEEVKIEEKINAKKEVNTKENNEQDFKENLPGEKIDEEIKLENNIVEKEETIVSPTKENEVKQSNSKQNEEKEPVTIIDSKKQEIWDALGMTKEQYYNQPMYSWEKVDFKTMNECLEYGDKYKPYLDGEVLYNCHDVLSTSGKFLGVMFDTEKLN